MKRKTIALVASLLICISLIGVGFAAWVISAPGTDEVYSQIQVETVTDNRLVVEAPDSITDKIVFGQPEDMSNTRAWLTANDGQTENLTVTFDVTVKNGENTSINSNDLNVTVAFDNLDAKITAAQTDGYIKAPSVTIALKDSTQTTGTILTYTVTITFAWGSKFTDSGTDGQNPYIYFNSKTITNQVPDLVNTTWGDYAKTTLEALEPLNNVSIPIVITANYK